MGFSILVQTSGELKEYWWYGNSFKEKTGGSSLGTAVSVANCYVVTLDNDHIDLPTDINGKITNSALKKATVSTVSCYFNNKLVEITDKNLLVSNVNGTATGPDGENVNIKVVADSVANNKITFHYEFEGDFTNKTHLLLNHFVDMAVQGYGWVS